MTQLKVGEVVVVEYQGDQVIPWLLVSGRECDVLVIPKSLNAEHKRSKLAAAVRELMRELALTPEDREHQASMVKKARERAQRRKS